MFVATLLGFSAYFALRPAKMPSFLLGVALGTAAGLILFPTLYSSINGWKYGIGAAVLAAFAVHYSFFLRRKSLVWLFVALVVFFLVSLAFDSRSMAGLPLLAGLAYAFFRTGRGTRLFSIFEGRRGMLLLAVSVLLAALAVNFAVTALFSSDYVLSRFPPAVAQKYQTQAGGAFGVLLGGRADVLVSVEAFLDKPWLGHGSWAKDTRGYRQSRAQKLYQLRLYTHPPAE